MKGDNTSLLYSHGYIDASQVTRPSGLGIFSYADGTLQFSDTLIVDSVNFHNYGTLKGLNNIVFVENGTGSLTLGSSGMSFGSSVNNSFVFDSISLQSNAKMFFSSLGLTSKPTTIYCNTFVIASGVCRSHLH